MWRNNKEAMRSRQIYGYIRVGKYYAEKYGDSTSLQIQSQHWGGECQLFIEGVAFDYFIMITWL